MKVGDEITYEIKYKNYKNEKADIEIIDKLDEKVEFKEATEGGVHTNGVVTWNFSDVEAGAEGTVEVTVTVLEAASGKTVVNGGDTTTVQVGNDNKQKLNTVENPVPDVPVKQESAPYKGNGTLGAVQVGDEITYTISYKNYKSEKATITIKDTLDKNVRFVKASDGGALADGVVLWTIPDVEPGTSGTVTLKVEVLESALESKNGPGKVVNDGDKASVQVGNDHEFKLNTVENPVPENPSKSETAPYQGTGTLGAVKVGDEITYQISYKNYKAEAANVVIKDTLDPNVAFVSADNDGACVAADGRTPVTGPASEGGGTVTWNIASVPARRVRNRFADRKGTGKRKDNSGQNGCKRR